MPDLALAAKLAELFVVPVECTVVDVIDRSEHLVEQEQQLALSMGPSRVNGFSSGRFAARSSLATFGLAAHPLLSGPERDVIWPPSICGSISHCNDISVAVVSQSPELAGLGVDVEVRQTLEEGVLKHVCTGSERTWLQALPDTEHWACVLFSIKESLFKCFHPVYRIWIDFHQAEVEIDRDNGRWQATLHPDIVSQMKLVSSNGKLPPLNQPPKGRFMLTGSHVFTSSELLHS